MQQRQRRTPLGWLQLKHERSRLLVALSGIAFADILMFMQMGFQAALYDSNTRLIRSLQADIVLASPQARNTQNLSTFSRRRLYQAMDVPGVESAQPLYASTVIWKNPETRRKLPIQVVGFDPEQSVLKLPDVNQQLDRIKLPGTVLFDRGSRGDFDWTIAKVEQGKTVTTEIEKRTVQVTGLFTLGASFGAQGNLVTSDQTFLLLFSDRRAGSISLGLLKLVPGYDSNQVVMALRAHLPDDVNVMTHQEYIQFEENYWKRGSPIGFIFGFCTAMAFVVGIVIVYQVLSADVNAHIKEYATFKAMGYFNRYLLGVVFEEAIILAVLGFIPGFILPLGLYQFAAKATTLPIFMTVSRAITVLILTILMCGISGAIATRKLQLADPADIF